MSDAVLHEPSPQVFGAALLKVVNLAEVLPEPVEYTVGGLFQRHGLHMIYAPSGTSKTYLSLRMVTELLSADPASHGALLGHPDLPILRPWRAVLWIGVEETAAGLRARWDRVLTGCSTSATEVAGTLLYRWALDPPVTLDKLEEALEGWEVDAVICDSVTAMLPSCGDEWKGTEWDGDNFAVRRLCTVLRGLAVRRQLCIVLVHHSGKDEKRGARGPSEWRNSVDVMIRLEKKPGTVEVHVEKQRDTAELPPFKLGIHHSEDAFEVELASGGGSTALSALATKVLQFFAEHGPVAQADAIDANLGARTATQTAIKQLVRKGRLRATGAVLNGSPVYVPIAEASPDGGKL